MKTRSFLGGCLTYGLGFIIFIYFAIWFVAAAVGLATGHLYLMAARGAPEQTIHGVWARIVSGIILSGFAAITAVILRHRKKTSALQDDKDNDDAPNQRTEKL